MLLVKITVYYLAIEKHLRFNLSTPEFFSLCSVYIHDLAIYSISRVLKKMIFSYTVDVST